MASNEDLRQPLINPFTSSGSSNVKYTESSPPTTLPMTSTLISSKKNNESNNKTGLRSRLKHRLSFVTFIFMSKMKHRLASRIELHKKLSFITDIMCFLGLLGIILMVIENEITFRQIDHQDTILSWCIKLIITITTVILIGLVFFYHRLDLILCSVNNSIDDWRVILTNKKIFLIIIEVIVCAIHPIVRSFPSHSKIQTEELNFNSTRSSTSSCIPIDVAIGVPMFLRFYLLCRLLMYHSHLVRDSATQSLGYLNQISIDFFFLIKTYLDQKPIHCLTAFCTLAFFIGSWSLRACQYQVPGGHLSILDSMWLFIVTFTTVGYGDIIPSSYCSRTIAALIALVGLLSSALCIAVLAQKLTLNRWEKYVYHFVINAQLAKENKNQSANIVKFSLKLWYLLRTNRTKSSFQYLQVKRKLFRSFNLIHQIKKTQRELVDSCMGLPEIIAMQRDTDTNTDQTLKKMANMEIKIDSIEQQLIHVNQTIHSFQNKLDLLVDKITK